MLEQAIQKRVILFLEGRGFEVVKTIVCNKKGVADILACAPDGKFWAIEMKSKKGRPSLLQRAFLKRVANNNGIALWADSFESFRHQFNKLTS